MRERERELRKSFYIKRAYEKALGATKGFIKQLLKFSSNVSWVGKHNLYCRENGEVFCFGGKLKTLRATFNALTARWKIVSMTLFSTNESMTMRTKTDNDV